MAEDQTPVEEFLSREKSGSRVDYDGLVTIGIATVLSVPLGSITRAYALMDLQDLLAPNLDERFQSEWTKLNEPEDGQEEKAKSIIQYRRQETPSNGDDSERGSAFQREWFRLLMQQISKKGLLGRPDFSEDESF